MTTTMSGPRVQVIFFGEIIADSREAIRLADGNGGHVYYFPRRDVNMARLYRSTLKTVCPTRGEASYYTLANGRLSENAAWSYEEPDVADSDLKHRLAFDPGKVDVIRIIHDKK